MKPQPKVTAAQRKQFEHHLFMAMLDAEAILQPVTEKFIDLRKDARADVKISVHTAAINFVQDSGMDMRDAGVARLVRRCERKFVQRLMNPVDLTKKAA
jgi:hypothetical protein